MIKEKIETAKKSIEVGSKAAKNFSHAASTLKTQKLTDLEKLKRELRGNQPAPSVSVCGWGHPWLVDG